ncbi:carboxylate-amine ligase [Arthrobacter mobilis]|uniref:Putative glutamate--cysteine ligase 2 n=1 Tax=Arthrobacter mobilis TaxID=2724944 RepID=A0A7X6HFM6_9MICC|nr:glutamate--cysteine ligase [Arthrobacter mobilis]NKX55485.1 glutamate--cysteine ligase [Arthrobacter mobilis]
MRTFGIEEEFLLVDPATGMAAPVVGELLSRMDATGSAEAAVRLVHEFKQEQIEAVTGVHTELAGLARAIREGRAQADTLAREAGVRVAALGAAPLATESRTVPAARCEALQERFALTAVEQLTCGYHIHVGVDSPAEGVAVLDRIRNWLPVLAALGANSPFWRGVDTGYAGYRTQLWGRWPSTGPLDLLGSPEAYRALVGQLLRTGVPLDEAMLYFDARLSRSHPTVEIRVSDVCLRAGDAVLIAALARALVETAAAQWRAGIPPAPTPTATLRLAMWQASRSGLEANLLCPVANEPVPAAKALATLLDHVRDALRRHGDEERVEDLLTELVSRGTGAEQQRRTARGSGSVEAAVAEAVRLTHQD